MMSKPFIFTLNIFLMIIMVLLQSTLYTELCVIYRITELNLCTIQSILL